MLDLILRLVSQNFAFTAVKKLHVPCVDCFLLGVRVKNIRNMRELRMPRASHWPDCFSRSLEQLMANTLVTAPAIEQALSELR